jgi:outer membrane protein assembly factor BamA
MYKFLLIFLFLTNITFSQEKVVTKIDFINIKSMNKSFLTNIVYTKEGQKLDSIKLDQDIIILNRLNGVSKATYTIILLAENNYQINYDIVENFSLIPSLNAGTTEDNGFYRIGLYEFNLLGRNIAFGGFYQYNKFNSFGINFSAPTLFSNQYGLDFNFQKLSSKEPLFIDGQKASYQYTNTSGEILGVYQYDYKNRLKLGFSVFKEDYQYLNGATNPDVPQKLDVNKRQLKLQYSYDDLNYDYYKVTGFKSNLYLQYVTSENNFQDKFIIGWNDFMYYKLIGHDLNWASRLRLGLATNSNSPFAPFSVDNNLNIRGVGNIIDRGTGTLVVNTEFRKTLYEKKWFVLQGNAFVDAGSWRNPGGSFSDFADSKNFRIYPGLGLRFIHKTIFNAVFRLDYGYGITKNATKGFVFGIGQYF